MRRKIIFSLVSLVPAALAGAEVPDTLRNYISIDGVTVYANRQADHKMHIPQAVHIIGEDRIAQINAQTSADMLSADGMITVQKSQQGGGSPVIRGFESSRVLLVVDGIRLNNLIYRGGHLQNVLSVNPSILERAEILYGPASVPYGSDALGGVVAFKTRDPRLSDSSKVLFSGSAFSRYGSVNDESTWHLDFNIGGEKFASYTSLTYGRFGDLRSGRNDNPFMKKDDGYIHRLYKVERADGKDVLIPNTRLWHQPGSGYHQYDLMQKFLFRPTQDVSHLLNFQFSNTGDVPRYDRLTDMKGSKPKFAEWYYGPQTRLLAAYTLDMRNSLGADEATFTLAYQNIKESRNNRKLNDVWLGTRKENVNIVSLNTDWMKAIGDHSIHAGIDGSLQFLKSTAYRTDVDNGERKSLDTRYPDGHNHMHNIDLYVSHFWNITPKLIFSDGLRVGYSTLSSTFVSDEFFPFLSREIGTVHQNNATYSLSAGITYNPTNQWKLAFLLSTGYRVPNIDDIGKVFDSQPGMVVVPNPSIKPEKTINADINIAHLKSDRLQWEMSMFGTYLFDAIALAPATLGGKEQIEYDGEMSDVFSNRNNRLAYVVGASTSLKVQIIRNLSANATLTYTYGNIIGRHGEEDMPMDHIAPLYGRVGLTFESDNRRILVKCYSLFNGHKPLSRYNLNGEDNIGYATVKGLDGEGLPAWFTLNLKASYRPNSNVMLQGGIENILDTEYRTFASGINAPGRNFYAAVRVEF